MGSLKGRVVAITGAASGIGLALAKLAASQGAKLALADIQQEALDKVTSELKASGVEVVGTKLDVSSSQEVDDWINATVENFGQLHGAANLAGVNGRGGELFAHVKDITNENWEFIISVNLTGLMYCLRAQLRVMGPGASIVNASSVAGLVGRTGIAPYSASKHGVVGLTKTAAKENGPRGIRVNAIAPGPIMTPMVQAAFQEGGESQPVTASYKTLPLQRIGEAEEVAKLLCFLLSEDSSFITGVIHPIDGGLIA